MLARSPSRGGAVLTTLGLVLGVLLSSSLPAAAADTTTTKPAAKCATPTLVGDLSVTGASVNTPGAELRTLDKDQATAFMQTWLAYSVFGKPRQERPPARLPVSQLTLAVVQAGQPNSLLIFYASDGKNAWVGAPAPAPVPPPPNDQKWIRVPRPKQTIAGFAGRMAPICTDPSNATTATTVGRAAKPSGTSSSGNGAVWALIIGGIVIVAGGGVVATRVLRRRAA